MFPLVQHNKLFNVPEGQFHAPFSRLSGHPPEKLSLQRLGRRTTPALRRCRRWIARLPAAVRHTRRNLPRPFPPLLPPPTRGILLAASGARFGPGAKTNRDFLFFPLMTRGDSTVDVKCLFDCVFMSEGGVGEHLSATLYKKVHPHSCPKLNCVIPTWPLLLSLVIASGFGSRCLALILR